MVELLASHARGAGIDTPHLQAYIFTDNCMNLWDLWSYTD